MKVYDNITSENRNIIAKLFTWMEDSNLLSEHGVEEFDSLGIDTIMDNTLFTEAGNNLLQRYYKRFKKSFFTEDNVNPFWNNRLAEIKRLHRKNLSEETSFSINTALKHESVPLRNYIDSIDINVPNDTNKIVLECTKLGNKYVADCFTFDKKGNKIFDNNFSYLSENNDFYRYDKDEDLNDKAKIIFKNIKAIWNEQARFFKGGFEIRFTDTHKAGRIQ